MSRKNESITLAISPEHKAALEKQAAAAGCTWGGVPNISEYMRRIAEGNIVPTLPAEPPPSDAVKKLRRMIDKMSRVISDLE